MTVLLTSFFLLRIVRRGDPQPAESGRRPARADPGWILDPRVQTGVSSQITSRLNIGSFLTPCRVPAQNSARLFLLPFLSAHPEPCLRAPIAFGTMSKSKNNPRASCLFLPRASCVSFPWSPRPANSREPQPVFSAPDPRQGLGGRLRTRTWTRPPSADAGLDSNLPAPPLHAFGSESALLGPRGSHSPHPPLPR